MTYTIVETRYSKHYLFHSSVGTTIYFQTWTSKGDCYDLERLAIKLFVLRTQPAHLQWPSFISILTGRVSISQCSFYTLIWLPGSLLNHPIQGRTKAGEVIPRSEALCFYLCKKPDRARVLRCPLIFCKTFGATNYLEGRAPGCASVQTPSEDKQLGGQRGTCPTPTGNTLYAFTSRFLSPGSLSNACCSVTFFSFKSQNPLSFDPPPLWVEM